MKNILLDIINNDLTANKSATRYLYKTHPDLWEEIVKNTTFLPITAKAKQRVWHIINDTYKIPLCPITNQQVKWHENRYLTTIDPRARMHLQHLRGDFINGHTPEANAKRSQSNKKAVELGRRYRDKSTYTEEQKQKAKQTWINKYGEDNPSKNKEVQEKIYLKAVLRGCTPREKRSLRRLYYETVWKITEENWKQHFDKINPHKIRRSENALDHVYSIQQGFRDNIPPYIIGHWTNLRIMGMSENSSKGMKCHKTQNQLFEDFDLAI